MKLKKARIGWVGLSMVALLAGILRAGEGPQPAILGGPSVSQLPVAVAGDLCLTNADCDDANDCTVDTCVAGVCVNATVPGPGCCTSNADCDDDDECTEDECVEGLCVNAGVKGLAAGELLVVAGGESDSVGVYLRHNGGFLRNLVSGRTGLLNDPTGMAFGPDNSLYVSSYHRNLVLRVHWPVGGIIDVFIPGHSGGLSGPAGLAFGPDGNLYVASFNNSRVLRYDGETGGFLGTFVRGHSGGLSGPSNLIFGPGGDLFVSSFNTDEVKRYGGQTGRFKSNFVTARSGGLDGPAGLVFGPGGNLYVSSFFGDTVNRYFGGNGGFLNVFVRRNSGGLDGPTGLAFSDSSELYVSSYYGGTVNRYSATNGGFLGVLVRRFSGGIVGPRDVIISPVSTCEKSGGPASPVNVTLREFSVTPDRSSAPAGRIRFHVTNAGTEGHEFLVIKTDLAPDALPTEPNGSYEENGPGTQLLDEIEFIPPGESADLILDLEAGNYVLICNIVNGPAVHYAFGMHAAFTVE